MLGDWRGRAQANGLIDSHEVRVCLKAVGQNIPMPVAKKLVQDHGSGKEGIDLDDFRRLVRAREQTCRALYDLLKGKADMSLRLFNSDDRERVGKNLTSLLGTQFNAKVFLEMVAAMDRDDDGAVSFKEFQRALLFSSVLGGEHGIYGVVQTSLSFMGFTDNPPNVPAWMSLVSGFTAGIISRTLTHPMERASIVMRAATDGAGLPTVVKRIVEKVRAAALSPCCPAALPPCRPAALPPCHPAARHTPLQASKGDPFSIEGGLFSWVRFAGWPHRLVDRQCRQLLPGARAATMTSRLAGGHGAAAGTRPHTRPIHWTTVRGCGPQLR